MGYMHDSERPLLSKLRARKAASIRKWPSDEEDLLCDRDAQTDDHLLAGERGEMGVMTELEMDEQQTQTGETDDEEEDERSEIESSDEEDRSRSRSLSDQDESIQSVDGCTQTDIIGTEDKAVNTRARERGMSTADPTQMAPVAPRSNVSRANSTDAGTMRTTYDDQATAANPPQIARRRRRRDRAVTTALSTDATSAPAADYSYASRTQDAIANGTYAEATFSLGTTSPPTARRSWRHTVYGSGQGGTEDTQHGYGYGSRY